MKNKKLEVTIHGIVQGVGFRPFIYRLALELGLAGRVYNKGGSVILEIEGGTQKVDEFLSRIRNEAPPLSQIREIISMEKEYGDCRDFQILESEKTANPTIYISPDIAVCGDCLTELFDREDRRFLFPFINCTNCGPRFTIIRDIPYDRCNTTMSGFPLCSECRREYENPNDRRYHAQPVCCPNCGPELVLLDREGERLETGNEILHVQQLLRKGYIIAVKGLGGYHLACNAEDEAVVRTLRKRKSRDEKPFALLVKDASTALEFCFMDAEERRLLESEKRPIVLLKRRRECNLPASLAPGNPWLGIMLPYTPVHLLLLNSDGSRGLKALVMTSGNRSSEPICYRDGEALETLKDIADYFLTNNRDIYIRTDDSVTRAVHGREYLVRRSRGYVPQPVSCNLVKKGEVRASILACGGELKNTFCINKGKEFFLSHHIGDLENVETMQSFEEGIRHFEGLLDIKPGIVAYDLHPRYLSTRFAFESDFKVKIPVQHHHAHISACMGDNDIEGEVIGVAFDGTGYGEDGQLWGGEFFTGSYTGFRRRGHLAYIKMPGGEAAIHEPWRMAASYVEHAYPGCLQTGGRSAVLQGIDIAKLKLIGQMLEKGINSPFTSSMGRLFDAVAALLGIRNTVSYEGQAAIELEYAADEEDREGYGFSLEEENGLFKINVVETIKSVIMEMENHVETSLIASRFHSTVADMVLGGCLQIRKKDGTNRVALSGGVFQNIMLLERCISRLERNHFEVFIHKKVPANDGGIALGQALMAVAVMEREESQDVSGSNR
jgi:hydrogenase maturation protein HypF